MRSREEALVVAAVAEAAAAMAPLEEELAVGVLSLVLRGGGGVGGRITRWRMRRQGRVMCSMTVGEALDPPAIRNSCTTHLARTTICLTFIYCCHPVIATLTTNNI